jgi:hypothetical protein
VTYNDLRKIIEDYTAYSAPEFLTQVDTFIRQAESVIYQSVRLPKFKSSAPLTISSGVATSVAPSDFLSVDCVFLPGTGNLLKKDPNFIHEAYPDTSFTGKPRFFAMTDDLTFLWGPTPDANYTASLRYFGKPMSIVDQKTETYIASRFPAALINGSLVFAAIFMKDPASRMEYQEAFLASLGLAESFAHGRAAKQEFEKASAAVESGELK